MKAVSFILVLLQSAASFADRRELYVWLEAQPSLGWVLDPIDHASSLSLVRPAGQLTAYYGITNSFHLGLSVRGVYPGVYVFDDKHILLGDGSRPVGTLRETMLDLGTSVVMAYRWDTGISLAPLLRFDLGGSYLRFNNVVFTVHGTPLEYGFSPIAEVVFSTRALVGIEYRISDHFAASLSIAMRQNFQSLSMRYFEVPLSFGYIFN